MVLIVDATAAYRLNEETPATPPAARPPAPNDVPPELADHPRYRILQLLGAGGMGVVYKAEHRLMERVVALKVINRQLTARTRAVERFRLEVKAAARLHHPNIVTAHDAEQAADLHFLVMEYVDGISLAQLVEKRGPLPIEQACHLVRQVALGLQHAHERGMVHRDIKPHNLMVTRKGQIKILDFGLARFATESSVLDQTDALPALLPEGSLTAASTVVGTPDFLAPEQARNSHEVDIRADLYALGCTLYFLFTGRPPFPGGSALEKLMKHWEAQPEEIANLPPEVAEILHKLMAKKPVDRYQTPAEVATALAPFARITPLAERRSTTSAPATQATEVVPVDVELAPVPSARPSRKLARVEIVGETAPEPLITLRLPRKEPWSWRKRLLVGFGFVAVVFVALCLLGRKPPAHPDSSDSKTTPSSGTTHPVVSATPVPRKILVILPQRFSAQEFFPLRQTLEEKHARVSVASSKMACQPNPLVRPRANVVLADVLLDRVQVKDYDAVVFLGHAGDEFSGDSAASRRVRHLIQQIRSEGKVVGALSAGQKVLASAGALKGKRVALLPEEARECGAISSGKETVVASGKLITARRAEDAPSLAEAVLRVLDGSK